MLKPEKSYFEFHNSALYVSILTFFKHENEIQNVTDLLEESTK